MIKFIESFNQYLWQILLLLILSVGVYLTIRSKCLQLRLLPTAIRSFLSDFRRTDSASGLSPYRALCTALAATVGTGNLAGVAGAIAIGGPGSIFWMWISGLLGMIVKFAEVVTAMLYRVKNRRGEWVGGPMINIQRGMPLRYGFLASIFSFFGVVAAFGIGNATQVNTIMGGIDSIVQSVGYRSTQTGKLLFGILLASFIVCLFRGGIRSIGKCTQFLVPFAAGAYIILALGVLVMNTGKIPEAVKSIFQGAFQPQAMTGGVVGSIFQTMRVGVARGVFTNEAGMGTASIAHATSDAKDPVSQGLLGIVEVFIDTILICTCTALVILCSGVSIQYGVDTGIQLTIEAFSQAYGTWVLIPLAIITCLLALATILGWGFYGARCAQFLFGGTAWRHFVLLQGFAVILGVILDTSLVWTLSEITNGLMAIPNLIVLGYLSPKVYEAIKTYRSS